MNKKIIIVDDKPENLYLLELILKGNGYITISAKNGEEALNLARKDTPDLIVSDILMPVMDGFTLCRELKKDEKLCMIPFIFYTATYTDPKDEKFALSLGADRFLLKPLDPDEFAAIIESVLAASKKNPNKTVELNPTSEAVVLREYNEALVRKLEDKILQAELAEKEVRKYNIALLREIEERRQAEQLLRESEERFRTLYNDASVGLYRTTPEGRILMANRALIEMLGYSSFDELSERNLMNAGFEESFQRQKFIEQIEKDGEVKDFELKWISKDGSIINIRQSARLLRNAVGEPLYYDGMVENITARKKAEDALRVSEHLFQTLAEVSPVGIFRTNSLGETTYVNPKWCEMSGLSTDEALGNGWIRAVHPDDREKLNQGWKESVLERTVSYSEYRFLRADGTVKQVMGQAVPEKDLANQIVGYIGTITDITGLKRAEEEIVMLANALKSINECVSITDLDDNIVFVNQSFLKTYGYSETELIGKNMELVRSSNNSPEIVNYILPSTVQGGWSGELLNKRKDGSEFPIYLSTTIITDKDNNPLALIGVAMDITEQKRVEKELIKAKEFAEQSNKMKDAFIANISHEIRTPLNGILGMTSIIKETYSQNITGEEEGYFTAITKSSDRIIRTIDLILNYSQLETGTFTIHPQQIELSSLCREIVNNFIERAELKSLSLSFQNDIGQAFLSADEYSINQVLLHLIDNAITYTKSGFVKVQLYRNTLNEISIDVIDSGIGMGEDYLEHVFKPYLQEQMGYGREYEGLGLSLAFIKKVLAMHNASISVKSKKGEGTTFTIYFNKNEKNIEEKNPIQNHTAKIETQETPIDRAVLLVEDDYINQLAIKKFILKKYRVFIADSFEGVQEILKSNKVDLILMDISLKGSKNGLEITRYLKTTEKYNNIPVIAATAHAFERDRLAVVEAGCDDYISKPFSMFQLLNKIDKFLQ